jgi:hypothetical protein
MKYLSNFEYSIFNCFSTTVDLSFREFQAKHYFICRCFEIKHNDRVENVLLL